MGSLSGSQFSSFSSEHQASVSSIKRLSIPFSFWNSVWLASLPTEGKLHRGPLTDNPFHTLLCARMQNSCQKHLESKSKLVGAAAAWRKVGGRLLSLHCGWMRMRKWQEASSRDNPSSMNTSLFHLSALFCCCGHVHNMEMISLRVHKTEFLCIC